jgi:hypothetical protein
MSVLENLMNEYKEAGELAGPIVPQLTNSYNQAKHQLEKGSVQNAIKFMKKYLSELNGENNQAHTISDRAKQNLSHHAQLLIEMWEKEEKK